MMIEQFSRTGDPALAVNAGIGAIILSVGYVIIWCGLNRGWGDDRKFWLTFLIVGPITLLIFPDLAFVVGALFRGMFMGSLPAVGWLSFFALILLGGVWIGIRQQAPAIKPQTIRAQPEPRPAVTREQSRPAVTAATSWPKPLPKAAPEPARLERLQTPPAVPLEYRRETMPVASKRRK